MRTLLTFTVILALAGTVAANDIGATTRPAKTPGVHAQNVPTGRQGGDTIADAVEVPIPLFNRVGTTAGYTDDYDEECPYTGSTSPDVVYTFTADENITLVVDLRTSAYDTKTYVYDAELNLVACNDDYYPDYTSRLTVDALIGERYYVVIDGYGGDFGDYVLNITDTWGCILECPVGGELEGEPEIVDGYVDQFNGGCGSNPVVYSHPAGPVFCGQLGYFQDENGLAAHDLDWLAFTLPPSGMLEIVIDAEERTSVLEIAGDCDDIVVANSWSCGPCIPLITVLTGAPGETVVLAVSPEFYWQGMTYEYSYLLLFDDPVAIEGRSWSAVKALFE